jgi:hypothetical protein
MKKSAASNLSGKGHEETHRGLKKARSGFEEGAHFRISGTAFDASARVIQRGARTW